jgi:dUTPase
MKHAFEPVMRSPSCFNLRAPYDIFIPAQNKCIIFTDVPVQLPSSCIGIISPCYEWKLDEHLDVVTEVLDSRRFTSMRVVEWNHTFRPMLIKRGRTIAMLAVVERSAPGLWPCGTLQHYCCCCCCCCYYYYY